jgi:hypothetical protein
VGGPSAKPAFGPTQGAFQGRRFPARRANRAQPATALPLALCAASLLGSCHIKKLMEVSMLKLKAAGILVVALILAGCAAKEEVVIVDPVQPEVTYDKMGNPVM